MSHTSQQISGLNKKGKHILSVIAKRTYQINLNGSCTLHEDQESIIEDYVMNEEIDGLFEQDIDVYPLKPMTDVVLKGKARSIKEVENFSASIEIGKLGMHYSIFADRKVYKAEGKEYLFQYENKISEIPLSYTHAYGGKDLDAEKSLRDIIEAEESFKYTSEVLDILAGSPYRYPRNPLGKGYIVEPTESTLASLELPNIENPYQLLSPENFICKNVLEWYKMPVPVCTDWLHPGWFPRVAYFGSYTIPEGMDENISEIKNKWASESLLNSNPDPNVSVLDFRACNGASLGLQSNHLTGGQQCRLVNIHPQKQEFVFTIPKEIPIIKIDGRNGKLINTDPVLQTILIEPELNRLTLVWRGSGKALRPYAPSELANMPYEVSWR
tara:strand:- start:2644 stop:3795 length:1152 start_codon:yes stop_codon:yes gene_type:complete